MVVYRLPPQGDLHIGVTLKRQTCSRSRFIVFMRTAQPFLNVTIQHKLGLKPESTQELENLSVGVFWLESLGLDNVNSDQALFSAIRWKSPELSGWSWHRGVIRQRVDLEHPLVAAE